MATPPSPDVPDTPAVPATVERMPAEETYRTIWFPCSEMKRPPPLSNATDVGLLSSAALDVAGIPSPRKPEAPHVPTAVLMTPTALTTRMQWLLKSVDFWQRGRGRHHSTTQVLPPLDTCL